VEWDGTDRARLESALRRGVVAVRYAGCEVELLAACNADVDYRYEPLTPKEESVEVRNADDLYARFPRGAVRLEGTLERAGTLSVDMLTVGRYESPQVEIARGQLSGTCRTATHVVTGLTVGAFSFHTGAQAKLGAAVDVTGVGGGGAASTSEREELSTDGDVSACRSASLSDSLPPEGCGALMRIEVVPLPESGEAEALGHVGKGRFDRTTPWGKLYRDGTWAFGTAGVGFGMFVSAQAIDSGSQSPAAESAQITLFTLGATAMLGGVIAGGVLYGVAAKRRRNVLEKAARAGVRARRPGFGGSPHVEASPRGLTLRF
jgi:hypothetical protein